MDDQRIGLAIRALRHRRGWTQRELGARAGVSDSAISDIERGRGDQYTVATIRHVLAALDARLDLTLLWGGRGDVDRLIDARHAALEDDWKRWMERLGWLVRAEVSFNRYGERGVIDLLSFHPPTRMLAATEVKTGVYDLQQLLGSLDVKARLARGVAAALGWRADRVVACLVLADSTTMRRRVEQHPALLARFGRRGREAKSWLRRPCEPATDLLVFRKLPNSNQDRLRHLGRRRVRHARSASSVDRSGREAPAPLERA